MVGRRQEQEGTEIASHERFHMRRLRPVRPLGCINELALTSLLLAACASGSVGGGEQGSGGSAAGSGSGGVTASGGAGGVASDGGTAGTGGKGTGGASGSGGGTADAGATGGAPGSGTCGGGTAQSSDVTINESSLQQKITGFGVSSAWAGSYANA